MSKSSRSIAPSLSALVTKIFLSFTPLISKALLCCSAGVTFGVVGLDGSKHDVNPIIYEGPYGNIWVGFLEGIDAQKLSWSTHCIGFKETCIW